MRQWIFVARFPPISPIPSWTFKECVYMTFAAGLASSMEEFWST
jgi:hypothetical protein